MSDWMPYPWQLDDYQRLLAPYRQGKMAHAMLVSGEAGTGKRHLLEGLAQKLLCTDSNADYPCGECKSCSLFLAGSHPDYLLVTPEGSKNIKVDQIRATVDRLGRTAQLGGMKVVLMAPAESMNMAAANALLKCLEEPGRDTVFLLLSHSPQRLLPTIRSRCQQYTLARPSASAADQWLGLSISDAGERDRLLLLASGNPLRALQYYQNDTLALYHKSLETLAAFARGRDELISHAEQIFKATAARGETAEKAQAVELWLQINQALLWRMIQAAASGRPEHDDLRAFDAVLSAPLFARSGFALLTVIQQALADVQSNSNPNLQLVIESVLIHWRSLFQEALCRR